MTNEKNLLAALSQDLLNRYEQIKTLGINERDFEDKECVAIYKAIEKSSEMNIGKLTAEVLRESGVDNTSVILQDFKNDTSDFDVALHKLMVKKQDRLRETIFNSYNAKIKASKSFTEKQNLSSELNQKLAQLDLMFVGSAEKGLEEIAREIYNEQAIASKPLSTGFAWIDEITMGLWRGLPHIIAGESGNGKSLLMKNIAMRMALSKEQGGLGYRVLIISLEMTKKMLTQQFLAMLNDDFYTNWYGFNIKKENMKDKLGEALKLASVLPNLKIDDDSYTPEKLAQKIRQSKSLYDVIIVDYFQALDLADNMNEGQAYNRASKIITRAIKETQDIAVVLLSQVTSKEGGKAKTEKQHQEAALRYSKQLLNDTAFELIVYQDELKDLTPDFKNEENKINLFIRKNRNGLQEQHTKLRFVNSKGIIGDWDKVTVKPVPKKMTKQEYLNLKDWETGLLPTHTYEGIPVNHLNRSELKELGFKIPQKLFTKRDNREGVRQEVAKQFTELAGFIKIEAEPDGDINFEELMDVIDTSL